MAAAAPVEVVVPKGVARDLAEAATGAVAKVASAVAVAV